MGYLNQTDFFFLFALKCAACLERILQRQTCSDDGSEKSRKSLLDTLSRCFTVFSETTVRCITWTLVSGK